MYVKSETTTNWEISLTAIDGVVLKSYFDIILTLPDCTTTYLTDPTTGYVAPVYTSTVNTKGNVTYVFTPATPGLHKIQLVTGTSTDYEVLSSHWAYSVCEPTTLSANIQAYPTNKILIKARCLTAEPFYELNTVALGWAHVGCIGRHADAGKMVIAGEKTASGPSANMLDIAIIDLNTGGITELIGALAGTGYSTVAAWGGIDCDRSTGRYVISSEATHSGNSYPAMYSTNLTSWTLQTPPISTFSTGRTIRYDDIFKVWMFGSGSAKTFVSADGITWTQQFHYSDYFSMSLPANAPRSLLSSAQNSLNSSKMLIGTDTGIVLAVDPLTAAPEVPWSQGPGAASIKETVTGSATNNPFAHGNSNASWDAGFIVRTPADTDPYVLIMDVYGQILKCADPDFGITSWTVMADRDIGGNGVQPNEITDAVNGFCKMFKYINGSYYVQDGNGGSHWWKYTTEEEPFGYGWTDLGSATGSWFNVGGDNLSISEIYDWYTEPLCFTAQTLGTGLHNFYWTTEV
jgi:hypothetical protein